VLLVLVAAWNSVPNCSSGVLALLSAAALT